MVGTKDFAYALRRDLYKYFFDQYEGLPSTYDKIFQVENSDNATETWASGVGMGIPVSKPEGEPIKFHDPFEGWLSTFTHVPYADGVIVTHELAADTKALPNFVKRVTGTWARGLSYMKEDIASSVFTSTSSIYDATTFFSDAHTNLVGTSFDNANAAALSYTNLQSALIQFENTNAYDERGNRIRLMADTLIVGPSLRYTAQNILGASLSPGDADNDMNVLKGSLNLIVWPWITSSTAWYLGSVKNGILFFNREGPTIDSWYDNDIKAWKASIYWRGCAGVTDWRYWLKGNA
jgi:hypothetical protein